METQPSLAVSDNDRSSTQEEQDSTSGDDDVTGKRGCLIQISHENKYRQGWDLFMGLILMYVCLTLPFAMAFLEETPYLWRLLDLVTDGLFGIDIPLNFITTYETEEGDTVYHPCKIISHYLSSWFLIDFISTFPLKEFIPGSLAKMSKLTKIFRALKIMKLLRMSKLGRIIPKIQAKFEIKNATLSLIKFGSLILLTAHVSACAFFLLAREQNWPSDSWVNQYWSGGKDPTLGPLRNRSIHVQYVCSFYWAITVMSTIGFGDIVPGTDIERFFMLFMMFIGASVFAFGITNMCTLVLNLNIESALFTRLQDQLTGFLESNNIQPKIVVKTKKYLLHKYYHSNVDMFGTFERLEHISMNLRANVLAEFFGEELEPVYMISRYKNRDLIKSFAHCFQARVFAPHEVIVLENTDNEVIFCLSSGKVEIVTQLREKKKNSNIEMDQTNEKEVSSEKLITTRKNSLDGLDVTSVNVVYHPSICAINTFKPTQDYSFFGKEGYCKQAKEDLKDESNICQSIQNFLTKWPEENYDFDVPLGEKKIVLAKPEIEGYRLELPSGSSFNEVASLLKSRTTISAYAVTYSDIYGLRSDDYWANVEKILKTQANTLSEEKDEERIKTVSELMDEIKERRSNIDSLPNEQTCGYLDISPSVLTLHEDIKSPTEESETQGNSKDEPTEIPNYSMDEISDMRITFTKKHNLKTYFTTNEKKDGEVEGEIPYKLATEEKMRNLISCLQYEPDTNSLLNEGKIDKKCELENLEPSPLNIKIGDTAMFVVNARRKVEELQKILKKNRSLLQKLCEENTKLPKLPKLQPFHV